MSPEDVRRLKSAHAEALSLFAADRDAFLREQFSDDPNLFAEARKLLEWHEQAGDFLNIPLVAEVLDPMASAFRIDRVGNWELKKEIGRGGSATVYLAQRAGDFFERTVAVKLLNRLSHSDGVFRKFQREIQTLARLEHPHIVRLYDANTTPEGLAYIVTEFVSGRPIDVFSKNLPLRRKLELFAKVCEGVGAAHRNLIVHRDIKPSNILVTDGGVPKLLDFGIALPLDGDFSATETAFERMTLLYASPEQIRGEKSLTTSTDVYSLGVVLYELIGDRAPFPVPQHELRDAILSEEPDPVRGVPSDLNAVILRALQKEPSNRYDSVDLLRDDVVRFINGDPVSVAGLGRYYRIRKFMKRHRVALALGGAATAIVTGLTLNSALSAREALRQRARVDDLLTKAFDNAIAYAEGTSNLRASEVLERTRLAYLGPLVREYPADSRLGRQWFKSNRQLGSVEGVPSSLNLGDTTAAEIILKTAVEAGEQLVAVSPSDRFLPVDVAATHLELGSVLIEMNRIPEAQRNIERAEKLSELKSDVSRERISIETLAQRSRLLVLRGDRGEALAIRKQVVRARRLLYHNDPRDMGWEFGGSLCSLGELLREMNRLDEAAAAYAEGISVIEHIEPAALTVQTRWQLGRQYQEYAKVLFLLGRNRTATDYLDQAITLHREVLQREPDAMSNQRALAICLRLRGTEAIKRGELAGARSLLDESLRLSELCASHDPGNARAQEELDESRKAASKIDPKYR